jgi:hypothetical protein
MKPSAESAVLQMGSMIPSTTIRTGLFMSFRLLGASAKLLRVLDASSRRAIEKRMDDTLNGTKYLRGLMGCEDIFLASTVLVKGRHSLP